VTAGVPPGGGARASRKGVALLGPEPADRARRPAGGRRVGTTLPGETHVAFKTYIARLGVTGGQAILAAIERPLHEG